MISRLAIESAILLLVVLGKKFTRFDRSVQMIFLRREGASRIVCKGTRWAIGFVEVNKYTSVFVGVRVMIAPGWIGPMVIGLIHD